MKPVSVPPLLRVGGSVSAEVAAHLEQLIVSGHLQVGDRLPPERELAASLGVSRTSLREAMFELETRRMVVRQQGRGSLIAEHPAQVRELLNGLAEHDSELANAVELRDVVEPRIASLAARRAGDSDMLSLRQILDESSEALDAPESIRLDLDFHAHLALAAQNPLLVTLCSLTAEWTGRTRELSHKTRKGRRISINGHHLIYEAVLDRDEAAAAEAMEKHLQEVKDVALRRM